MGKQIIHKEVRSLVRELEDLGYVVVRENGNHLKVLSAEGNYIYSLPSTPGRGRWKQNLISELRRRGIQLAGVSR